MPKYSIRSIKRSKVSKTIFFVTIEQESGYKTGKSYTIQYDTEVNGSKEYRVNLLNIDPDIMVDMLGNITMAPDVEDMIKFGANVVRKFAEDNP